MKAADPLPNLESGELFELLELLGAGSFAQTFRARVLDAELIDEYGTDEIALKIPLPGRQRALHKDFKINAMLHVRLKPLRSVNVVRYLDVEIFRGQLVMAMEYVRGGSLRRKLGPLDFQKRLPIADAIEIAEGILNGLAVIHQEHIFHRDIKPENILMDGRTAKVADLGIAKMLEADEQARSRLSTIYYMSPEMLGQEGGDFRSDLWSVGVTLYEMVTGKLPFGSKSTPHGTLADSIRAAEPTPAHQVTQDVPRTLSSIIHKALRKERSDRFRTAEEMRDALKQFRPDPDELANKEISAIRSLVGISSGELEVHLRDLTKRYPESPRAYQELGEFYNGCHRFGDAIPVFRKGIECHPNHAHLHLALALAYKGSGQDNEFVRCLGQAVELDRTLERYAKMLLSAEEVRDALKQFRPDSNELANKEISAIRSLAGISSSELEARLLNLIVRYPESPRAYQELGEFYNGCQRFDDAISVFGKGIERHPNHAHLHLALALAYKGLGRNNDFARCLRQAVELDHTLERYAKVLLWTVGAM